MNRDLGARRAVLLSGVAGVLSSLAFDPVSLRFAMVVGVALLLVVAHGMDRAPRKVVAAAGAAYGLAFMGPLIWWMRAVSDGAYVALVLAQVAFFVAIMFALRATARLRWWPLWTAAAWTLGEWARDNHPFTGFPWGRLAHTSIDTPFAPYARLVGLPGTTALLAVVAALLVLLVVTRRVLLVASLAGLLLLGLVLPTGTASPGATRQVAIIQGDVPGLFLTWKRGEIFELHAAETARLAARVEAGTVERPDFVLWPENGTDIDPYHDTTVRTIIEQLSGRIGAPILVGGLFDGPTVDTAYNAGVVWTENGPGERYVKRRPVPYGEYVPFRQTLGDLVPRVNRDIPRDMLAGDEPGSLTIGNTRVGDTICYDIAYDDVVRDALDDGAQVLVVQTSNAAFTGTAQPEQQWDISRLRAIETGRSVLVPSTNGISGVIDADGRSVMRAPLNQPATLLHEVTLAEGRTLAQRVGQPLEWLWVALGVLGWILGARRATEMAAGR